MNDEEVITLVKDQRDKIPFAVPVDTVIRRGRTLRRRRLLPAGALSIVAAATAIVAVVPMEHGTSSVHEQPTQGGTQSPVRLAAWAVSELANGNISVTIRELRDPAGLQRTLRQHGVPASVTFQTLNPACRPYPASTRLLKQVFPTPYRRLDRLPSPYAGRLVPATKPPRRSRPPGPLAFGAGGTVIVIDPSALPRNTGVQLASTPRASLILTPRLVHATRRCTG